MSKKNNDRGVWQNNLVVNRASEVAAESYRTLRSNIEFLDEENPIKTILVTSANAGEGKSTTAANLALSFAQTGQKVLYIDGDLRRPTGNKMFGLGANKFGLSDVLRNTDLSIDAYDSYIHTLSVGENYLCIILSGRKTSKPSELLRDRTMRELLQKLKGVFDYIIIDAPPVLLVTDAQILSQLVDGVLFVVKSRQTNKKEVIQAKKLLENVHANIIGSVINSVDTKDNEYSYYGYEGYYGTE